MAHRLRRRGSTPAGLTRAGVRAESVQLGRPHRRTRSAARLRGVRRGRAALEPAVERHPGRRAGRAFRWPARRRAGAAPHRVDARPARGVGEALCRARSAPGRRGTGLAPQQPDRDGPDHRPAHDRAIRRRPRRAERPPRRGLPRPARPHLPGPRRACSGGVRLVGSCRRSEAQAGGHATVQAAEGRRARVAAMSTASALGLAVDDAVVLSDSNRLVVRLMPCDVVARIAPVGYRVFLAAGGSQREVEIVQRVAEAGGPVAVLEPRVEPRVFLRDGFEIAMWTYFEPVQSREVSPKGYAEALERLHHAMGQVDVKTPHFTDRAADVERWVAVREDTPDLTDED